MISTRSAALVIDTVVCLTLAKWETVSGRFGGYLRTRLPGVDHLLVGQRVEFDVRPNKRTAKPQAFNVKVLNPVLHEPLPPEDDPYTAHMDISQTEFMRRRYD